MKPKMKQSITTAALALAAITAALAFTSCASLTAGLTGTAVPATAVQRAGQDTAPVILVASQDLALAEQAPEGTVHGLYNASALASQITDARGKSSK